MVLILADDLGFNDISFHGDNRLNISTPNIDSIGRDGVSFSNAYAGHATCAPSRAALLTGRYASRVGYEFTPTHPAYVKILGTSDKALRKGIYHEEVAKSVNTEHMSLPISEVTIAKALSETYNYSTMMIGKWHLGDRAKPPLHGFDQSLGFNLISRYLPEGSTEGVEYRLPDMLDELVWANAFYHVSKDGEEEKRFTPEGYLTDYFAKEAASAISSNKGNPFFLYLPFTAPHTPYQALRSDYNKLSHIHDELSRVYAAMILALDRAVGTILKSIEDNGLADNTIVIFTNDNGAPNWSMQPEINKPFRGWKGSLFEGGIRVPLFMKWPAVIRPAQVVQDPVSHVDLFPTIMSSVEHIVNDAGNVPSTSFKQPNDLSGVNLLPLVTASSEAKITLPERDIFWRSGHYKALRRGKWKIQKSSNPAKVWLFNLEFDPYEKRNLADVEPFRSEILPVLLNALAMEDDSQTKPLWPSLTETAIFIDKLFEFNETFEDEYVYWPN